MIGVLWVANDQTFLRAKTKTLIRLHIRADISIFVVRTDLPLKTDPQYLAKIDDRLKKADALLSYTSNMRTSQTKIYTSVGSISLQNKTGGGAFTTDKYLIRVSPIRRK